VGRYPSHGTHIIFEIVEIDSGMRQISLKAMTPLKMSSTLV